MCPGLIAGLMLGQSETDPSLYKSFAEHSWLIPFCLRCWPCFDTATRAALALVWAADLQMELMLYRCGAKTSLGPNHLHKLPSHAVTSLQQTAPSKMRARQFGFELPDDQTRVQQYPASRRRVGPLPTILGGASKRSNRGAGKLLRKGP